jgi:hypothetical protein
MACPEAVETKEEFDLLGAFDGTDEFHGSFAAGAFAKASAPQGGIGGDQLPRL